MITKERWNMFVKQMKKEGFTNKNGVAYYCTDRQRQQNTALIRLGYVRVLPELVRNIHQIQMYQQSMRKWQEYANELSMSKTLVSALDNLHLQQESQQESQNAEVQKELLRYECMLEDYAEFLHGYSMTLVDYRSNQHAAASFPKRNEEAVNKAKELFTRICEARHTKELLEETGADLSFYIQEQASSGNTDKLIYAKFSF